MGVWGKGFFREKALPPQIQHKKEIFMLFGWFYYDWTMLIVLPAMIFAACASIKVKSTFEKYSNVRASSGMTGAEAARRLLNANGLYDVRIERLNTNELADHYDPRNQTLNLSAQVYDSNSAAAIGVACHEAGHAIQHAEGYAPLKARMAIIPVCNFGSKLAFPLFLIGLLFAGDFGYLFMLIGIACFSLATLFQLITLPVEFNASKRALVGIGECGIMHIQEEHDAARQVLSAAAMTYVAALATSLLSLLRLIVIANNRRR
jgi:Zn-dependent membrane protease YugP